MAITGSFDSGQDARHHISSTLVCFEVRYLTQDVTLPGKLLLCRPQVFQLVHCVGGARTLALYELSGCYNGKALIH